MTYNYIPIINVANAKSVARQANKRRDWETVHDCCEYLERHWHDDHAAMRFYTELEQEAGR